jgi:hypothetical protein
MPSILYVGMAIMLLGSLGLIGIVCLAGLLLSILVATDGGGMTWEAFKERLPTFLAVAAFLVMVGVLVYAAIVIILYYGG